MRRSNGVTIIERSSHAAARAPSDIEHPTTCQREDGRVVILGLDDACRPT